MGQELEPLSLLPLYALVWELMQLPLLEPPPALGQIQPTRSPMVQIHPGTWGEFDTTDLYNYSTALLEGIF